MSLEQNPLNREQPAKAPASAAPADSVAPGNSISATIRFLSNRLKLRRPSGIAHTDRNSQTTSDLGYIQIIRGNQSRNKTISILVAESQATLVEKLRDQFHHWPRLAQQRIDCHRILPA